MDMSATAAGAATSKSRTYDVFINHRGPDVKKTFVAHLYAALNSRGFRPFLDAEDIAYALPVFEKIDKALKGACVHVAVFSKGYADSIYCLDELCEMLKSEQRIIPVFYDVEARDLRRIEDGPYNNAFIKHQKRGRTEKIPIWKEALRKVANYRSFRMDEVNGNEHQLIRRILVEVRNALRPDLLPGKRFGLEKSMKDVVKTLESVSVIGLVGMGGIGKTTLAMEIYNHFLSHQHFEDYCFLRDVRSSQTSVLQDKVLRDLRLESGSRCDDHEYRRILNGALKDRRVLVIVDDISDANQFEALIPEILIILGLDCRIVITSRRHDVLNHVMKALPAASKSMHDVQMLNKFDSRRLFNIHAFMSETPREDFVELADTIADACGGLPLALEVMGNYLFDKEKPEDKEIWSEALKVLQENPDIMDKVRVSYDGLPTDGDKEMFQDIACMLIGVKQEVAMTIWKSCKNCGCNSSKTPASSLRNLMDRSMVKLDEHDRLQMHDVLRDVGREIVKTDGVKGQARPPKKWRHLWDRAIALKELSRGKANTKARGICLTVREQDDENYLRFPSTMSCEASNLGSMKELHLLNLDGCNVVHDDFSSWSQQLRWLQWRFYSFRSFPPQLKLPHLVVLDLSWSRELTCLWEQNVHSMVNLDELVVLDLTYCFTLTCLWENDVPIQLPRLQVLRLVDCQSLVKLPNNMGRSLPILKRLEMRGCKRLRTLPNSIGLLTELEHLDLQDCSNFTTLINGIVELLPRLQVLRLVHCYSLVELPYNLGKSVPRLKRLEMKGCRNLWTLPNSIGLLTKLEHLDLQDCSNISALINVIVEMVNLARLVVLDLACCFTLTCLWENDAPIQLPRLQVLRLVDCKSLVELPNNMGRSMPRLKRLEMKGCQSLWTLPNSISLLTELEHLDLQHCSNLVTLINGIVELGNLAQLVVLDLTHCHKLTCLWREDAHIQIPRLQVLRLVECISLANLPSNLGRSLPTLKRLEMKGCRSLWTLPNSIGLLTELEHLDLQHCSNLVTLINGIVELGNLAQLVVLDLTHCHSLTCLWENDAHIQLPRLQVLRLVDCKSLNQLPNNMGISLPKVKRLEMKGCRSLWTLPNSIGLLTELEHLDLQDCSGFLTLINDIVELVNLAQLVVLDLSHFEYLTCLWENDSPIELPRLQMLTLVGCISLVALPNNIGRSLPRLKRLEMKGCKRLHMLPNSIGLLADLEYLDLQDCSNFITLIDAITELMNLAQLIVLDLSHLEYLTCLWENDAPIQLPQLQVLRLVGCKRVIGLPNNLGKSIPRLKRLEMKGCMRLRMLPESIGLLTKLEHLDLHYCDKIITLPKAIMDLVSIKTFILRSCMFLQELPLALGGLINLEEIDVSWCKSLPNLPINTSELKKLKEFKMQGAMVQHLPTDFRLLTPLRSLSIDILGGVSVAPKSLGNLKCLVKVRILQWEELLDIESLPQCLEHLSLEGCCNLIEIPSLMPMKSLVHLNLMNCRSLRHIHGLECVTTLESINLINCASIEDHGVNIIKDNKAMQKCYLMGSKVGMAYNNKWLEDEPSQQFISCRGDRIPSCLPNCVMAHPGSWPPTISSPALLAEATISRKAECIVITWCTVFHLGDECYVTPHTLRFEILRDRRQLAITFDISLPSMKLDASDRLGDRLVHVLTLRRKHRVVEAMKPGDRLRVYMCFKRLSPAVAFITLEASICVVYDEVERLLLEVNSELLSEDASQALAIQFGELVLKDEC